MLFYVMFTIQLSVSKQNAFNSLYATGNFETMHHIVFAITHRWVSQNQSFSLIYRFLANGNASPESSQEDNSKIIEDMGRFFSNTSVHFMFYGKDGTLSLSTTQRKKGPPFHRLVLCSQSFLTKHQKKKKSSLFTFQTVKLQWFRKSWESQTRYVNWNKAGDSGKSRKQQVKMSE